MMNAALIKLVAILSENVCNAGGYNKSILRSALLDLPDDHPFKEQLLDFELALNEHLGELVEASQLGRIEPTDICWCNGWCRSWRAWRDAMPKRRTG